MAPKISPPPILSVLHENKALNNFHKRGQHPIAGHIKGLEIWACFLHVNTTEKTLWKTISLPQSIVFQFLKLALDTTGKLELTGKIMLNVISQS